MTINYQETAKDLLTRIRIHEQYGARDIDRWTVELLRPQAGMAILDVGCGAGKQCFLYSDYTQHHASITGGDFSEELLGEARKTNAVRGDKVVFQFLDFNRRFDFPDKFFDLVSSAFAIYYAADLNFTFGEAHRVLKPGGRLFVTGPLPENKQMFYQIIEQATRKPIPPMPGSSRFRNAIFQTIAGMFARRGTAHLRKSHHVSRSGALHGLRAGFALGGPQALDLHVRQSGRVRDPARIPFKQWRASGLTVMASWS